MRRNLMKIAALRKNPLAIMWTARFAVTQRTSEEMAAGEISRSVSLNGEGCTMPAFSFEKISSPARRAAAAPVANDANKKQRGVIVQILERFSEKRVKRGVPATQAAADEKKPAK